MPDIKVGVIFPGEALLVRFMDLFEKVIDGQPPDVRADLWRIYLEDIKWWRRLFGLKIPGEE